MIKQLNITKYRKLSNLVLDFSENINLISGTNGTCKTSLLHMISNSFQSVKTDVDEQKKALDIIKNINTTLNPKIETLARGDKEYNDPAIGYKGTLYTAVYSDERELPFRRHNSKLNSRFSVKLPYSKGASQTLPQCMVIYLGLSRLYPFGEHSSDSSIRGVTRKLPESYQQQLFDLYNELTAINISSMLAKNIVGIRKRADFKTDSQGIDSNTISDGQDNVLSIVTALVSLKYYYEVFEQPSILIIDEVDATLHPCLQNQILQKIREYSQAYKIQIFCTTHSLSLLGEATNKKDTIIYLLDQVDRVISRPDPTIQKIEMWLHEKAKHEMFKNKKIPIFTEDEEAREILTKIFEYFRERSSSFKQVIGYFHFVQGNYASNTLINLFCDEYLLKNTLNSICILDGDQAKNKKVDLRNNIILLPSNDQLPPDKMVMEYAKKLNTNNVTGFWDSDEVVDAGYNRGKFQREILPDIESIESNLSALKEQGESTHGIRRERVKKLFQKYKIFFVFVIQYWINDLDNQAELQKFFKNLYSMFKKVAAFHSIDADLWGSNQFDSETGQNLSLGL